MQRSSGIGAVPITFAAAAAAGAGATLVAVGERIGAGAALALAVLALAWANGRPGGARPRRAAFAASLLARAAETAPLAALAWVLLPSRAGIAAVVALSAAFVAAYVHVKGTGLGFAVSEHPAALPARMAAVGLGLVTGWVEAGLWLSAGLSALSAAAGSAAVARQGEPA